MFVQQIKYQNISKLKLNSHSNIFFAIKFMTRCFNFQEGIDRANQKALSNAQKVQKWIILGQDFSVPGGELGPTMKMKRHVVLQKYGDNVEKFYV